MTLLNLPNPELKAILKTRKEKFNSYRVGKKQVSQNIEDASTEDISEVIERLTQKEAEISSKKKKKSGANNSANSTDTTKATKTYTEKIKGGYFGKRRSRF
ncbi:hypothetical protein ATO12_21925 [Aquimarina atlantica]|uniref:Uncharacterized protein n=1 Tax=Aquimarina atlantica TaxID=1317122 RepID=A0A023BS20_9FLAO|nr:hypothetical protein [Aquimarina atlantica]EZH72792.1 hypothetical protein ATO12_21925 [Aquimarina atlantica]